MARLRCLSGFPAAIFAAASLVSACGDPGFFVWVDNQDAARYQIALRSDDELINMHWDIAPGTRAILFQGPGDWTATLRLFDADCRLLVERRLDYNDADQLIIDGAALRIIEPPGIEERPTEVLDAVGGQGCP